MNLLVTTVGVTRHPLNRFRWFVDGTHRLTDELTEHSATRFELTVEPQPFTHTLTTFQHNLQHLPRFRFIAVWHAYLR